MARPRRRLAAVVTFVVTLALTAALGSSLVGDRLGTPRNALLDRLITGVRFPQWRPRPANSAGHVVLDWVTPIIADVVLAVLVGAVAALVVSARPRFAALLAGWGLTMVLAAAVGAARVFALIPVDHPGAAVYASAGSAITDGLWFGLVTGWLNGVVLAAMAVRLALPADVEQAPASLVEPVRIWSPTQPDWQPTQDMTRPGAPQPAMQPTGSPPATMQQPATMQPTTVQPTAQQPAAGEPTVQPWPPAPAPGA